MIEGNLYLFKMKLFIFTFFSLSSNIQKVMNNDG